MHRPLHACTWQALQAIRSKQSRPNYPQRGIDSVAPGCSFSCPPKTPNSAANFFSALAVSLLWSVSEETREYNLGICSLFQR